MPRGTARSSVLVFLLLAAVLVSITLRTRAAAPAGTTYVGTHYYVDDFYNYLSYVEQAQHGALLMRNKLAPPSLPPTLLNLEWLWVGWLAALLGGRPILAYGLFGLAALAALVALVDRWLARCGLSEGSRLAGLLLVFTGGGLGGVLFGLGRLPGERAWDIRSGAFPFVEALANPHFVAGTVLLLGALSAFAARRPALGAALGIALALVRPYDAGLLVLAEGLAVALRSPIRDWPRRLAPLAAVTPALAYDAWIFLASAGFRVFSSPRYVALAPRPGDLLLSLGPALVLSLTSLNAWRDAAPEAREHLARLALWAVLALAIVLLHPVSFALQFVVGAGLPLLALGALGLARTLPRALPPAVPLFAGSSAVAAWLAATPGLGQHVPVERYRVAEVLRESCRPGQLVLAPDDIGLFVGGLTPCWPWVSHAAASDYDGREAVLLRFYDPRTGSDERASILASICPRHVVLPLAVPAGWLGPAAPYRPRFELTAANRGLSVWTRDDTAPACAWPSS